MLWPKFYCSVTDLFVFTIQFGLLNCFLVNVVKDLRTNLAGVHVNAKAKVDFSAAKISCLYLTHFTVKNILVSQIISLGDTSHHPNSLDHVLN